MHSNSKKPRLGGLNNWRALLIAVKTMLPIAAGIAVVAIVIAWLSGTFQERIAPGRTEPTARTLDGQATDIVHEVSKSYLEEAVGTLKAASRSIVSAKVLARIEEIAVSAGDQVTSGDTLIRLDSAELRAKLKQTEQALVAATANRDEAESNHERQKRLLAENATSQSDFDESVRRLDVARSEVLRSEQAIAEANALLSYTVIKAPRNGRVVDRLAEPGDTARPGEPLLVLYDAASLRLEAPVLENLAVKLKVGDKLEVYVDSLDRRIESTVDEIVPQADAPSRSFLVKCSLPRSEDLYEGMFGRLYIPGGERRHLCLATNAIRRIGQLEFVDVVLPGDRLERRFIKTGRVGIPGRIEVLSGLKADERVVLHTVSGSVPTPGDGEFDGAPTESGV